MVFVNTSNHAMAEHDANHELWKWEYVPGLMDYLNRWMKDLSIQYFRAWMSFVGIVTHISP